MTILPSSKLVHKPETNPGSPGRRLGDEPAPYHSTNTKWRKTKPQKWNG